MKLDLDARQVLDAAEAAGQIVNAWQALARIAPVLTQVSQIMAAVPALEAELSTLRGRESALKQGISALQGDMDSRRSELTALEARLQREASQASDRIVATIQAARDQAKLILQDAEHAARDIEEKAAARRTQLSDELDALAAKRDEAQANLDNMNLKISETLAKLAALAGGKVDEPAS